MDARSALRDEVHVTGVAMTANPKMAVSDRDADQVQVCVTDATLGLCAVGKRPNLFGCTFQDDRLKAILVVQMDVHCRYDEVVMLMLRLRQALSELTFAMVVDI